MTAIGIACGVGAAVFWAAGFVAARHGIAIGLSPADLALHRYLWSGLAILPFVLANGASDVRAIGWFPALALTLLGGPLLAIISYAGFLLVPLGHGAVIQPSCAALGGLLLATIMLKEKLPLTRAAGALIIIAGLMVIAGEALATIGTHGLLGDFAFATAGLMFATFGMLLKLWRVTAIRSVGIVSMIALVYVPIHGCYLASSAWRTRACLKTSCKPWCRACSPDQARHSFTQSVVMLAPAEQHYFRRWFRASPC